MPKIYNSLCICCGKPISGRRSHKVFCSTTCQVRVRRLRQSEHPDMTDLQYRDLIKQRIADGIPHPFKSHPLNQLLTKLKLIKDSINYYQESGICAQN